jgi:hypothetical protein
MIGSSRWNASASAALIASLIVSSTAPDWAIAAKGLLANNTGYDSSTLSHRH